jgi:hypothetical protein
VEPDGSVLAALHLQQLKGLNFITRDDQALSAISGRPGLVRLSRIYPECAI